MEASGLDGALFVPFFLVHERWHRQNGTHGNTSVTAAGWAMGGMTFQLRKLVPKQASESVIC